MKENTGISAKKYTILPSTHALLETHACQCGLIPLESEENSAVTLCHKSILVQKLNLLQQTLNYVGKIDEDIAHERERKSKIRKAIKLKATKLSVIISNNS